MELIAKPRAELGKKVNALRRAGFVPGVVYGKDIASQAVSVRRAEFLKMLRSAGESTIFKLQIEGGKAHDVLIYDVSFDPLKDTPRHVDFYAVSADRTIRHNVPLEFAGEAPAVKNLGGVLVKVMQEIEIEALPKDLPHSLKVDISALTELEQKLHVSDLKFPKGVKHHGHAEDVVVLVETPRSEEELKAMEEAPAAAEIAEVKTEQEVKAEERIRKEAEVKEAES